jgi:opacity protein-like surface antigen
MISFGRSTLLGAVLALGSVSGAAAADLGGARGGSLKDYGYQPNVVASNPSFYLRLDGGIANHDRPFLLEDGVAELTDARMGRSWTLGGGVGYYFSKNVRGDLTYDHRFKSDISGYRFDQGVTNQLAAGGPVDCHTGETPVTFQSACQGTRAFGLKSDVFLANIYYDFDNRSHITPYLGVGLGFVRHKTTSGTVTNELGVVGDIDSASQTNVAAALMGGFSVQVHNRLAVDAGYRFLYLGDAATGAVKDRAGAVQIAPDPTIENIHAHEFRLGLRYDFR